MRERDATLTAKLIYRFVARAAFRAKGTHRLPAMTAEFLLWTGWCLAARTMHIRPVILRLFLIYIVANDLAALRSINVNITRIGWAVDQELIRDSSSSR